MTLAEEKDAIMEMEPGMKPEKPKKRRLERDEDLEAEETGDAFDFDGLPTSRRGRKVGRRVSGVYREIRSLQNIGQNADVLKLVFSRMPTEEMLVAGCISPLWLTVAYHVLREQLGNSAFVRFWRSELPKEYLWINWDLHFHDELLGGVDEKMEEDDGKSAKVVDTFPSIQAVISVANRTAYEQFIHEEAKLPFRQDHIFAICQNAVMTTSNLSCLGTASNTFSTSSMLAASLFIPKSEHFTMKGFGLEVSKDVWTADDIQSKVELYQEDIGDNQTLKALLLIKYTDTDGMKGFVEQFTSQYSSVELLAGDAEEIGFNRIGAMECAVAVGYAFYAGPGATISVYGVDFLKSDSGALLQKMKEQTDTGNSSFCFVFTRDDRRGVEHNDGDEDDDHWSYLVRAEPPVEHVLEEVKKWLPATPMLGVNSSVSVTTKGSSENSNVDEDSSKDFTFGFILVTYN